LRNDKLCCGRCIFLKDEELGIGGRGRSATSPVPTKAGASLTTSITPSTATGVNTTTTTSRASSTTLTVDDSASHSRRPSEIPTERKTPTGGAIGSLGDEKKALPSPAGPSKRSADSKKAPKEKIEYKRGELIGKGSFGKVFMGMNAKTGELIAIKQVVIKSTEDNDTAKEIENEISLMHNLRHPHIVTLLETQRYTCTLCYHLPLGPYRC
jgi:hypothetical protein